MFYPTTSISSWLFLANRGLDPVTGMQICSRKETQRVNAILSTSGMYDQSGEFAFTVGLPAKSGAGGDKHSLVVYDNKSVTVREILK